MVPGTSTRWYVRPPSSETDQSVIERSVCARTAVEQQSMSKTTLRRNTQRMTSLLMQVDSGRWQTQA